jgi:hypothetical protein
MNRIRCDVVCSQKATEDGHGGDDCNSGNDSKVKLEHVSVREPFQGERGVPVRILTLTSVLGAS